VFQKLLVTLFFGIMSWAWIPGACTPAAAMIIDHTCTDIDQIPARWLDKARQLTLHYAHTSHGSQIPSGLRNLESLNAAWGVAIRESATAGLPPQQVPPVPRIYDGNPPETYIEPDDYWETEAGLNRTRAVAATGDYGFSMWSWCGQVSWYSAQQIQDYLDAMDQLENEFPGMRFVYFTGHLDGTGSAGILHQNNERIREYCRNSNKILFDFADIERYNPDGQDFLDQGADDACNYDGGNWAEQWCAAHPGDARCDYCDDCDGGHTHSLNCNQKARAFWWMLARLAGWSGSRGGASVNALLLDE